MLGHNFAVIQRFIGTQQSLFYNLIDYIGQILFFIDFLFSYFHRFIGRQISIFCNNCGVKEPCFCFMPAIPLKADNVTCIKSQGYAGYQQNVEIHKIAQFSDITVKNTQRNEI